MYWCVVSVDYPATDIVANYDKFISGNSHYILNTYELNADYKLLGYTVIVSTSMRSKVFGALFASI